MSKQCEWIQEEDESNCWSTKCGHLFCLNEGPPSENKMVFCCYCGGSLTEKRWDPEESDDE